MCNTSRDQERETNGVDVSSARNPLKFSDGVGNHVGTIVASYWVFFYQDAKSASFSWLKLEIRILRNALVAKVMHESLVATLRV